MNAETWQRVKDIVAEAADRPAGEREPFVAARCPDPDLRREVLALLESPAPLSEIVAAAVLTPGTEVGPYRIVRLIGRGGMGEVYRASDSRLARDVAIKVLAPVVAADREGFARFEREARLLASLSHPHICALYDIGCQNEVDYLVLELLEGDSLADRLKKGPLPVATALGYAVQIADALAKAHTRGIVHRDLKPGNVMVTGAGAKLLDFGLAKRAPLGAGVAVQSRSPTSPAAEPLTIEGAIVGTFRYMAPEQVEGVEADARSDIWALGCLIYEMVLGKPAFEGRSQASLMAAVLEREPDLSALGAFAPALEHVVRRCLAKAPDDRWQSAADVHHELVWIHQGGLRAAAGDPGTTEPRSRPTRVARTLAAAAVTAIAAGAFAITLYSRLRAPAEQDTYQFIVPPPDRAMFPLTDQVAAISPDGRRLAFVANTHDGKTLLWVRALDATAPQLLAGTDGASRPFWSPDSRALGFFAQGKLKRIDPSGGAPQTVTDAPNGSGGSWSSDDVIVFAPRGRGPLLRVPAAGGIATPVTTIDPNGAPEIHCCPSFLPDGRHFLFSVDSERPERYGVYVGNVETKDTRRLIEADSGAFAQPGYLLSLAGAGTLNAQRFDTGRLQLTGEAFALAENIGQGFSVSQNGVLCYSAGQRKHQLVWFDRHGDQMAAVSGLGNFRGPELAADDKRVAFEAFDSATSSASIWMQDLSRRITSRFALDPASQFSPIWAPDGSRLLFFTVRNGEGGLYHKNASGTGEEQLLTQSKVTSFEAVAKRPTDWSSDGHVILYDSWDGATKWDILALPLSTDGKPATPAPFLQTSFTERTARFSPDDRWVVYVSEESGKSEVYVQPFAKTGDKWKISTDGGFQPRWRRDGKELFYLAPDKKLMAVDVRTGPAFEAGTPRPLFEARVFDVSLWSLYDVSADGRQFLVTAVSQDGDSLRIAVVVNWIKALAAR